MDGNAPIEAARRVKPDKDVAVYIDYENLYISLRSTVNQNPSGTGTASESGI